jgi:hypothetical protein
LREISLAKHSASSSFVKSDTIELLIDSEFNEKLKNQLDFIKERVGASKIYLSDSNKKYMQEEHGKIKDKTYKIAFNKQ